MKNNFEIGDKVLLKGNIFSFSCIGKVGKIIRIKDGCFVIKCIDNNIIQMCYTSNTQNHLKLLRPSSLDIE